MTDPTPAARKPMKGSFSRESLRFHLLLTGICVVIATVCLIGFKRESVQFPGLGDVLGGMLVVFVIVAPVPAYFHQTGREKARDCALLVLWAVVLGFLLPLPVLLAGRVGLPFQDAMLARADQLARLNVPSAMEWAVKHPQAQAILGRSYELLRPMMLLAVLLPAFTGKLRVLKEFVLASVVAILACVVISAVMPAIGPWVYYHFQPDAAQQLVETQLRLLRSPGTYQIANDGAGIVCFPSFHVAEAVLAAIALWSLWPLRVPVALLTFLIAISTLTTGWHYYVDVVGGVGLAVAAMGIARAYVRREASLETRRHAAKRLERNPVAVAS